MNGFFSLNLRFFSTVDSDPHWDSESTYNNNDNNNNDYLIKSISKFKI